MSKPFAVAATIAAFVMVTYLMVSDHSMEDCLKTNASFDTCHRTINP